VRASWERAIAVFERRFRERNGHSIEKKSRLNA